MIDREALHSSGDAEWFSPLWVADGARQVLRGIELDPASSAEANRTIQADRFHSRDPHDPYGGGLVAPWTARTVFLNPPYGTWIETEPGSKKKINLASRFVEKLIAEYAAGAFKAGIALLNATPDRCWFMDLWRVAHVCFLYKRLRFWKPGPAGEIIHGPQPTHGNCLFYLGPEPERFASAFAGHGQIVPSRTALDSFAPSYVQKGSSMIDIPLATPTAGSNGADNPATAVRFTELTSTVKVSMRATIGALNLITGGNRSGKTGCLSAVRLALTGKHPIGHRPAQLAELCATGHGTLIAELSDGGPCSARFRIAECGTDKPVEPPGGAHRLSDALTPLVGEHILPTVSLRSLLSDSTQAARHALLSRFGHLDATPKPRALSEAQQLLWNRTWAETQKACGTPPTVVETLADLVKRLDNDQKGASREANRLEKEAATAAPEAVGSEQIPELEAQLTKAQLALSQRGALARLADAERIRADMLERARSWKARWEAFEAEEQAAAAEAERNAERRSELTSEIAIAKGLIAPDEDALTRARVMLGAAQRAVSADVRTCLLCTHDADYGAIVERLQVLVGLREQTLTELQKEIRVLESKLAQTSVLNSQSGTGHRRTELERERVRIREAALAADTEIAALSGVTAEAATYSGPAPEEITRRIAGLRQAESERQQIEQQAQQERWHRQRSQDCATLKKEAKRLLKEAIEGAESRAVAAVNRYMPPGFLASLLLTDTDCRWAVAVGDTAHGLHAMCKSEEAILGLALSLAWSEGSPLRVLLLDDEYLAMLEPANLQALLDKIKMLHEAGTIHHVFAAWPSARIDHTSEIPAGWTVIDVDRIRPTAIEARP